MTKANDKTLVRAALAGEKKAFSELYDYYAPLIRAVCYDKTGNLTDAQDLTQDVFICAYENLNQLRKPELFSNWIVGIARNHCKSWHRMKTQIQNKQNELKETFAASFDESNDVQWEHLRENISRLPAKERLALHTFYLLGSSADEARGVMGLSRSGFYRVLERARDRLKKLINQKQEQVR